MRKYLLKAKSAKAEAILQEQMVERSKMGFKDKLVFDVNFKVETMVGDFTSLEITGRTRMIELIDSVAFIKELKRPFLEAGCLDKEFEIILSEVN